MNKFFTKFVVGAFALAFSVPNANAQTQLFTSTSNNQPGYRIPSIVRYPADKYGLMKGGLWAFADLRYQGGDIGGKLPIDITSRKLVDGTTDWAEPVLITHRNNSSQGYDYAFSDPATVVDRESGKILLMTAAGRNSVWVQTAGYPNVARHVYDPETGKWTTTEATSVFYGPNNSYASHLFVSSGRMIQSTIYKKDKYYRIYAAICTVSGNGSRVAYSDDFGATWSYLGGPTASPIPDGDECKVEELPDGSILLNAKRYNKKESGKTYYGRCINIFTFTDVAKGEGSWDKVVTSGTENVNDQTFTANCNAEIMLVPAKKASDNSQTYLLLLAGPNSTGRNNGCIFWKELPSTAAEYRKPSNYVSGWSKYVYSPNTYCAYITMALDKDGNIALLDENGGISYRNYSLSIITSGAYTYSPSVAGTYHTTSEPAVGSIVMPTLSVNGGTYTKEQQVEIKATDGATIYYTLDGSEPQLPTTTTNGSGVAPLRAGTTTAGTQTYKAPITISEGVTTIKALAADNKGNVSRTVTASYYVTSTENTTAPSAGKLGTTITLDKTNATKLNTSNGQDSTIFAFLRHNSTHIQLIASTGSGLKADGSQSLGVFSNNMSWSTPDSLLRLANGKMGGTVVSRYSYYCILAPKGYRFLSYEFVLDKSSENGASLQEYKYGSNSEIELIGEKGIASKDKDVTFGRTLTDGTNVLYFQHDALENSDHKDQTPIVVKSLKLTYVVDEAFDALVPNKNGTKIHSGFGDFGTFSQPIINGKKYNWGFANNVVTDLMNINVKKADGTTPETYSDGSNYYFLAKSDGDYYVEAPTKFRVIGATVNLKRGGVTIGNYETYTPSATAANKEIIFTKTTSANKTYYLKYDESQGKGIGTENRDEATKFSINYTGSGYTLKTGNKYLYQLNVDNQTDKASLRLSDTEQTWSYSNGLWQNNGLYLICTDKGVWGYTKYSDGTSTRGYAGAQSTPTTYTAGDYTATFYNRENTGAATNGEQTLTEANATPSITVSDMNNDAVHIKLSGIQSGSAALFNVNLKILALDPEVSTIEAAAKIDGKVEGNAPVTSDNYIFNNGQTVEVPVPSTTGENTPITMVLRNASNAELTKWYTKGGNINNPDTKGGYSNLYLISSTADSKDGMNISIPHPDARTAVDQLASTQIPATNIQTVAKHGATTLRDSVATAASIGSTTVTTTLAESASQKGATQYYVYSADRPTWEIMPDGLGLGKHIDFRFYSIKVKPVKAEKPGIEIVPIYTSTLKGDQKKQAISNNGNNLDKDHTYVGIKVTAKSASGSATATYNALTAEEIYKAIKDSVYAKYKNNIYKGDTLRTVLYVDMSGLSSITTANQTTMQNYAKRTADNCLFFMPQGFAANNLANTIAKQSDGSYKAIGDVTLKDQQPFFTPYDFTTGTFSANYTREGTVLADVAKVRTMAVVLPIDITLDAKGHPYLGGATDATSYITYRYITGSGELTGNYKGNSEKPLTYGILAQEVTTQKADANKPYYVDIDKDHEPGFQFSIANANFVRTPYDSENPNTVAPDNLQNANGTWTAHGTYNGVTPDVADNLWYFSGDYFWKSSSLQPEYTVVNVRPFRAYFTTTATSKETQAAVVYDPSEITPTGIHDIQAAPAHNGRVYTIDGRYVGMSLDNLAPGLYIQNGRKVVKQ